MKRDKNKFPIYQAFALIFLTGVVFLAGDYLSLTLVIHGRHIAHHDKVILGIIWHLIIVIIYTIALVITAKKEASTKFNYLVLYGGFFLATSLSLVACNSIA